jgi:hypothetical protein
MSLRDCIDEAEAAGDVTPEQARYSRDLFDAIYDENVKTMGPEEADAAAGRQTFDRMKADAAHSKRVKILQAVKFEARAKELLDYPELGGVLRPGRALQALVEGDQRSRGVSLAYYQSGVEAELFSHLDQVLFEFRKTLTGGNRNRATQLDMVRELFGEDTGNASAREMAAAWRDTAELARQRANAAGMRIEKRADWGLPQRHDARLIRDVTKDEWIAYTQPLLDMKGMVDGKTGLPFNEQTLAAALSEVYDNIKNDSLNNLIPGTVPRGRALHNRRTDHRFLKFKGADNWLKYQERFGESEVFDAMVDHIRDMARDITKLEVLGPNPDATVQALRAYAQKKVNETTGNKASDKLKGDLVRFDNMYKLWTHGEPTANTRAALIMGGTRNTLSAALLGGASITALTDFNTQRVAAQFIGMPVTPLMGRIFREMRQDPEAAKFAARMGLVAENFIAAGSANARYFGDHMQPGVSRRIADTIHRATGLTGLTRAGRQAFGLEFQGYLADQVGKKFDDLHPGLQEIMRGEGLSADNWDTMRSTELLDHDGATFLRILDIASREDVPRLQRETIAMKAMAMMERQMDQAVPSSTLRARTVITGPSEKGTFAGEVLRGAGQFKSFPVTFMLQNAARQYARPGTISKIAGLTGLFVSMTIAGGIVLQTKQVFYGRDPRPVNTPEFWVAALTQGGGLGIIGDFVFSGVNRFGGGFGSTLAGPLGGLGTDTINLTIGNMLQLAQGDDTRFAKELVDYVSRYTPGSNIFYLRLALERRVVDQIRLATDPKARKTFRRRERRWERDYGQKSWWSAGDTLPKRGPNFGNLVAD